jgi:hypothetical protein
MMKIGREGTKNLFQKKEKACASNISYSARPLVRIDWTSRLGH